MKRDALRGWLLAGLALASGTPARAAELEPARQGLEVAFRTGALIPTGHAAEGGLLSDAFGVQFPLWIDLGYRFDRLFVGAYGQYAFGLLGGRTDCPSGGSCSVGAARVGFELQLHPAGRKRVDPWFGVGFGFEWDTLHVSVSSVSGSVTAQGWDFLRLGTGLDFAVTRGLRIGPFFEFSLSEFVDASLSSGNRTESQPIDRKDLHFWLSVGLKITVLP